MACGIDDTKPSLRGEYDHDIEECRRVIANLRTRVADLEAANERKDAALRFFGKHTAHHGHECECAQVLIDALSDAGEGKVREQARRALSMVLRCEKRCSKCKPYVEVALDALEVK